MDGVPAAPVSGLGIAATCGSQAMASARILTPAVARKRASPSAPNAKEKVTGTFGSVMPKVLTPNTRPQ